VTVEVLEGNTTWMWLFALSPFGSYVAPVCTMSTGLLSFSPLDVDYLYNKFSMVTFLLFGWKWLEILLK